MWSMTSKFTQVRFNDKPKLALNYNIVFCLDALAAEINILILIEIMPRAIDGEDSYLYLRYRKFHLPTYISQGLRNTDSD
jgi:hypothetical protein